MLRRNFVSGVFHASRAVCQCMQEYARVLSDALALGGGLAVPVAWVKRTLCDVVQAREAHEVGVLLLEKYGRTYHANTIHVVS